MAEPRLAIPEMMEVEPLHLLTISAEGVEIPVPDPAPVDELDAEFERRAGLADELRLVDAQQAVEVEDMRDRRLADPDGADRLRFDQVDLHPGQHMGQRRGRHPAGGAAADHDDAADRQRVHRSAPAAQ